MAKITVHTGDDEYGGRDASKVGFSVREIEVASKCMGPVLPVCKNTAVQYRK